MIPVALCSQAGLFVLCIHAHDLSGVYTAKGETHDDIITHSSPEARRRFRA